MSRGGRHVGGGSAGEEPPIIAIVGPTAVGKSGLALALAPDFGADIVSADSRQVYRYMDVGTAKPTQEERARVAHYMLDLVPPDEVYSAQRYREEGLHVLRRIGAAGRVALVTGGTGFYLRALLDGLSLPAVPPDPDLRERLREEARTQGAAALHERLARSDPESARRVHPNNLPRVIRALEIVEHLGGPVPPPAEVEGVRALFLGLTMERDLLRQRAEQRIRDQVAAGLVEETRLLLEMGYSPKSPALDGFGYRQIIAHLQGRMTIEEAITKYQTATNQYIRRQMTWLRVDRRIVWLDACGDLERRARKLIEQWLDTASA